MNRWKFLGKYIRRYLWRYLLGLAVLDRHHPPCGEGAPVANAVHLVDDGHARIAAQYASRAPPRGWAPMRIPALRIAAMSMTSPSAST